MSSPFPSCFRLSPTTNDHHNRHSPPPPPPPPPSTPPNLTNYLYHTETGLVSLTWSRSILGRSVHLRLHPHPFDSPLPSTSSTTSFHLHIKPFIFWKKHGSKTLSPNIRIFWNLSKAKFPSSSSPEPHSSFYLALVIDHRMSLLVGDSPKDAYSKSKARNPNKSQFLLLKKEHALADSVYATTASFGGRTRKVEIDCGSRDDSKLCFSVDGSKVLQIKRLKWKFRGNERVEVDGVPVQISWDVYNWLFEKGNGNGGDGSGHAIFMFKFEEEREDDDGGAGERGLVSLWAQQNWNESYEWGKMSSSSVSVGSSAGSFGGSSSVMEWSSVEENELVVPIGFSLIVYAWKR